MKAIKTDRPLLLLARVSFVLAAVFLTLGVLDFASATTVRSHTVPDKRGENYVFDGAEKYAGIDIHSFTYKKVRNRLVVLLRVKDLNKTTTNRNVDYEARFFNRAGDQYWVSVAGPLKDVFVSLPVGNSLIESPCATATRRFNLDKNLLRISIPMNCLATETIEVSEDGTTTTTKHLPAALKAEAEVAVSGLIVCNGKVTNDCPHDGDGYHPTGDTTKVGRFIDLT